MSENLKRFLVDLASNPDRMVRFAANPLGELDGVGLTAGETAALLSRNSARLRQALGASTVDHMTVGIKKKAKKKATKKKSAKK